MRQENLQTNNVVEHYEAPDIEMIDIELNQNILGGSVPDMPVHDW
jgi:hypothetical protein